jgi:polyhydroxyalkanoate synthesis regulator phasin
MTRNTIEEALKTAIYTGVGFAAGAAEKLQKSVDELVEKGKIPAEEGKKVVEDFMEDSKKRREETEDKVKSSIKGIVDKFDFPTRKDYESLVKRVEKLEKAQRAARAAKSTRSTAKKTSSTASETPKADKE